MKRFSLVLALLVFALPMCLSAQIVQFDSSGARYPFGVSPSSIDSQVNLFVRVTIDSAKKDDHITLVCFEGDKDCMQSYRYHGGAWYYPGSYYEGMVSFTPLPGKFELCFAVGNDNWSHDFYGRPVPERKTIIDQMVADRRAVCHEVVIPDTKKG